MAETELRLADAIDAVRAELRKAQDAGRGSDVRFTVGTVEVEFAVEVVKSGGGEASVKVFSVVSVGGKGAVSRGETNRVKVVLNPTGVRGEPFEVGSSQNHRPDAAEQAVEGPTSVHSSTRAEVRGRDDTGGSRPGG